MDGLKKERRSGRQQSEKVLYRSLRKNAPNASKANLKKLARCMVREAIANLNDR